MSLRSYLGRAAAATAQSGRTLGPRLFSSTSPAPAAGTDSQGTTQTVPDEPTLADLESFRPVLRRGKRTVNADDLYKQTFRQVYGAFTKAQITRLAKEMQLKDVTFKKKKNEVVEAVLRSWGILSKEAREMLKKEGEIRRAEASEGFAIPDYALFLLLGEHGTGHHLLSTHYPVSVTIARSPLRLVVSGTQEHVAQSGIWLSQFQSRIIREEVPISDAHTIPRSLLQSVSRTSRAFIEHVPSNRNAVRVSALGRSAVDRASRLLSQLQHGDALRTRTPIFLAHPPEKAGAEATHAMYPFETVDERPWTLTSSGYRVRRVHDIFASLGASYQSSGIQDTDWVLKGIDGATRDLGEELVKPLDASTPHFTARFGHLLFHHPPTSSSSAPLPPLEPPLAGPFPLSFLEPGLSDGHLPSFVPAVPPAGQAISANYSDARTERAVRATWRSFGADGESRVVTVEVRKEEQAEADETVEPRDDAVAEELFSPANSATAPAETQTDASAPASSKAYPALEELTETGEPQHGSEGGPSARDDAVAESLLHPSHDSSHQLPSDPILDSVPSEDPFADLPAPPPPTEEDEPLPPRPRRTSVHATVESSRTANLLLPSNSVDLNLSASSLEPLSRLSDALYEWVEAVGTSLTADTQSGAVLPPRTLDLGDGRQYVLESHTRLERTIASDEEPGVVLVHELTTDLETGQDSHAFSMELQSEGESGWERFMQAVRRVVVAPWRIVYTNPQWTRPPRAEY